MQISGQLHKHCPVRVPSLAAVCALTTSPPKLAPAESGRPLERRWRRDPSLPTPRTEITRFPHAVLEVKLSLHQGEEAPEWIKARPSSSKF